MLEPQQFRDALAHLALGPQRVHHQLHGRRAGRPRRLRVRGRRLDHRVLGREHGAQRRDQSHDALGRRLGQFKPQGVRVERRRRQGLVREARLELA